MYAEDVEEWLDKTPFQPFELQLSTGERLPVRHPDAIIVTETICYLGIYRKQGKKVAERVVHVTNNHIVKIEPLRVGSNGRPRRPLKG
jgi:hypothetical protein